jgi:hypothetical protein
VKRAIRRALTTSLLVLSAAAAFGQELDIFDPNDFIDPRERGAEFPERGLGVTKAGSPFAIVRLNGGYISDYQWSRTPVDADVAFLHVTSSLYHADKQLNLKLTAFRGNDDARIPSFRASTQFGLYFLSRLLPLKHTGHEPRISGRLMFTLSVEDNPFRDDPAAVRRDSANHEFGVQADLRLPLPVRIATADHIDGSFVWMRRRVDDGDYVDRATYIFRFRQRLRSNGRLRLNGHIAAGVQRNRTWECCLARAVFTATFVVPRLGAGINIAFAPTHTIGSRGDRRSHNEFAVYLDRTVFAHLSSIVGE